ncbi:MAG TPA: hypothetical protein VH641_04005 [Streptosporangiaceae bacterium]
MSAFSDAELEYLSKRNLGRPATIDGNGTSHVVPLGLRYHARS